MLPAAGAVVQTTEGSGGCKATDLDIGDHADTELLPLSGVAAAGLFCPQIVVAGEFKRLVEVRAVVTGVEHQGRRHLKVLEVVAPAEVVPASDLVRPNAYLRRKDVHGPFDRIAGLGSPGATVGIGRGQVGEVAIAREAEGRHGVHPRVEEAAEQRHTRGDEHHVGAHVGVDVHPDRRQLAVGIGSQLDVLELASALVGRAGGFGPRFGPADRSPEVVGQGHRQDRNRNENSLRNSNIQKLVLPALLPPTSLFHESCNIKVSSNKSFLKNVRDICGKENVWVSE